MRCFDGFESPSLSLKVPSTLNEAHEARSPPPTTAEEHGPRDLVLECRVGVVCALPWATSRMYNPSLLMPETIDNVDNIVQILLSEGSSRSVHFPASSLLAHFLRFHEFFEVEEFFCNSCPCSHCFRLRT